MYEPRHGANNRAIDDRTVYRKRNKVPLVRVAPLPARARFLNVIESVFSGLATSVIHNREYLARGKYEVISKIQRK